ncbi:tyrosine-type recombinase/integrase [Novipirellula artificiosorum]|uniref:Tyr recombinase domain-containing protein n=1 Tax=Novipirellula artificiosorum TaxID=2528016 RepID=A0A5C6DDU8_9BACT|nr:phage integrase SAM-like domain-containing protein [Novipirellula artificiosorum]TWU33881.1 hypothetical protein Poly41_48810 [Novipirellula artificiosorum]
MASLRKESDRGRTGWRLQFRHEKKRRSLWLGPLSKRAADAVARHVEELVRARASNVQPEPDAAKWARGVDGRIRDTLCGWGLVDPIQNRNADSDRFLGPFCDKYIAGRTDIAAVTLEDYTRVKGFLVDRFGQRCLLTTITPADAIRWQRWLVSDRGHSEATVSKYTKKAKAIFADAVRDRLIPESPFADVKPGSDVNRTRDHYISRATAIEVLKACPDDDWRLIFAFARFAGLRRCEILVMTWADILWDIDRLRIDSPKTGLRFCPIFPELMPFLLASSESAPDGATRCIRRYHRRANLGTQMNRIIEQAGIVPWEKTFGNLRATRRTELQEHREDHVINAWLGHSSKTAEKHYLQVHDDHWAAGASSLTGEAIDFDAVIGGVRGGVISAANDPSRARTANNQSAKTMGKEGSGCFLMGEQAVPLGHELSAKTRGF